MVNEKCYSANGVPVAVHSFVITPWNGQRFAVIMLCPASRGRTLHDAHAADPLANLNWHENDFRWVTEAICEVAEAHSKGRVVSTLEGGYDLDALAASTVAHVTALKEHEA